MSGYTDDAVVRHGVLLSSPHFIQKPFAAEALARKVREVLDAAGPRRGSNARQTPSEVPKRPKNP